MPIRSGVPEYSNMNLRKVILTQRSSLIICLILFGVGVSLVYYSVQREFYQQLTQNKNRVLTDSSQLINSIEGLINSSMSLMLASLVYVETHPEISQQEFENIAAAIMKRAPFILNLGLAKDNVITHIYPLHGNEAALGLRYMDNPSQKTAVIRAIESKQAVLAGPINLLQGGRGLINRIPIFLNDSPDSFWGIASVVIKADKFFKQATITDKSTAIQFALRGKDGLGAKGDIIYGDAAMFDDRRNLLLDIHIPNGSWQMVAAPLGGWSVDYGIAIRMYIFGIAITLFVCGLIYLLLIKNIELKREKSNVVKANDHKTRFFTYMTHELRTPLTAIYGVIRMLEGNRGAKNNIAITADLLGNAKRNCERLIHLINDILDVRKLELGQVEYKLQPLAVNSLITEAAEEMRILARQYQIDIVIEGDSDSHLMIKVDQLRIIQVLVNLLANAIKFSPANSTIKIEVGERSDSVCISVTDQGPGIDQHKLHSIFDEFVQADQDLPSNKLAHGTGLGLAISKKLIEDQGGVLSCTNSARGGAIFYFILPKWVASQELPPQAQFARKTV